MRVRFGYIIAFISGIGVLLIINFLTNQGNSSVKINSGLYPLIYKSIEDKQSLINNVSGNEAALLNYQKQLEKVKLDVAKIRSPMAFNSTSTPDDFLREAKEIREQIQQAFETSRLNLSTNRSSQNPIDVSLNNIAEDVGNNFSWKFDVFWSDQIYLSADSLAKTNEGISLINSIKEYFKDTTTLKRRKDEMGFVLKAKQDQLEQLVVTIKEDKEKITKEIAGLNSSLGEVEQSSKDRMLMYVVIPLFGLVVILLMVLPVIYKQNSEILNKLFEQKIILQIFTVFILVMSILLLGIGDKVKGETLGTLLGGISVYILQKSMDEKK